jgi:hypothetical protein
VDPVSVVTTERVSWAATHATVIWAATTERVSWAATHEIVIWAATNDNSVVSVRIASVHQKNEIN